MRRPMPPQTQPEQAPASAVANGLKEPTLSQEVAGLDPILETVIRFFAENGWKFTRVQSKPLLSLPFRGEHGNWQCWAQVREER